MKIRTVAAFALALFLVPLFAAPALADPLPAAALVPLDTLVTGINADDTGVMASAYSAEPTIVDEFPPFQWQGAGAVKKWSKDLRDLVAAAGITQIKLVRRPPTYFHRDGHLAYLCVPMTFSYVLKGSPVSERGAFVLSMVEIEGTGWKISASAWYLINNSTEPPLGAGLK
jgi:hypothetical protein